MNDSPEAKAAKAESWAIAKAKTRPMTQVARPLGGGFGVVRELAGKYGKLVVQNMRKAGLSAEEIDKSRKRMLAWLKVVEKFDASFRETLNDPKLPAHGKCMLMGDMLAAQDQAREEMFGE